MQNLWFQGRYVEPILSGEKTNTIRKASRLMPGDVVGASVGPRKPFATLRITGRALIRPGDIADAEHRDAVAALYPGVGEFVELRFERL